MTEIKTREGGINSLILRIIGFIFMIAGLYGEKKGYGYDWIEAFSWTSFAIFAFLLSEGIKHTSDKALYYRRFALFTAISEICYNLFYTGNYLYKYHQSAMCTLFAGLIIIGVVDFVRKKTDNMVASGLTLVVLAYAGIWLAQKYSFAFSSYGIQTICIFFLASRVKYSKITQLISFIYIAVYLSAESVLTFSFAGLQYPLSPQTYVLAALPFIWLYNGERGSNSLILRVFLYMVYPLSLLAFWLVKFYLINI